MALTTMWNDEARVSSSPLLHEKHDHHILVVALVEECYDHFLREKTRARKMHGNIRMHISWVCLRHRTSSTKVEVEMAGVKPTKNERKWATFSLRKGSHESLK